MNVLETVLGGGRSAVVDQLARQFGLPEGQARSAMEMLVPALSAGIRRNAESGEGLRALDRALQKGNHDRYLNNPELLAQQETREDGNGILGHVFGSKDVSREVASRAADKTGVDTDVLKQMLPLLATVAMGALSKQREKAGSLDPKQSSGSRALDMLSSFLDADKDGSAMDDLGGIMKKFF